MDREHQDYVNYIQRAIESVCPYEQEGLRRLYHAGFLSSYLASKFQNDPMMLREFKRYIEKTQEKNRRRRR